MLDRCTARECFLVRMRCDVLHGNLSEMYTPRKKESFCPDSHEHGHLSASFFPLRRLHWGSPSNNGDKRHDMKPKKMYMYITMGHLFFLDFFFFLFSAAVLAVEEGCPTISETVLESSSC